MNKAEPLIKQGWLRVLLFCICFFVLQMVAGMLLYFTVSFTKENNTEKLQELFSAKSYSGIVTLILFNFFIVMLLVLLFRKKIDNQSFYSLGWNLSNHKLHAATGLLASIAAIGLGTLILTLFKNLQFTGWVFNAEDLVASLGLMILVALAEELMFRGYILNNLMQSTGKYPALIISSLLFALAHITNPDFNWLTLVNIFLAGMVIGINYIYTQNLWYAICFHFGWNFLQGPVLGYHVSGINFDSILQQETSGSTLLTGGGFGFEGSLIASLVMIMITVVLAVVYQMKTTSLKVQ